MPADTRAAVLEQVCGALTAGDLTGAASIARQRYPFVARDSGGRGYTEVQSMRVFLRDGFVDRYSGDRLVFPGTLRLLSKLMPEEFPAHPSWKMSATHMMFWDLFPTIDHVVPVARGGADEPSNWVTTSMLRNSAKAHWTLDELGWRLQLNEDTSTWDGLTGWATEFLRLHPEHLGDRYLARWNRAATTVRAEGLKDDG